MYLSEVDVILTRVTILSPNPITRAAMLKTGYTIRKRGASWQVILSRKITGDKRIMISRKTKAAAGAEALREMQRIRSTGIDRTNLASDELRACAEAVRILKEKGFASTIILEAAVKFATGNDPAQKQRTVSGRGMRQPLPARSYHAGVRVSVNNLTASLRHQGGGGHCYGRCRPHRHA